MAIHSLAGKPAPAELLIDVPGLEREFDERQPDVTDPGHLVSFGTSGHRGSPLEGTFTRAHILAMTQTICDYRQNKRIADLAAVLDFDVIRSTGIAIGIDPLGGAAVGYWKRIAERYGLNIEVRTHAMLALAEPALELTHAF